MHAQSEQVGHDVVSTLHLHAGVLHTSRYAMHEMHMMTTRHHLDVNCEALLRICMKVHQTASCHSQLILWVDVALHAPCLREMSFDYRLGSANLMT